MGDFHVLVVWQKAHQLTIAVYRQTGCYPAVEQYGLTSQTRRAAASIPMNIAEGCGRNSDKELGRYCRISLGSANELEYQLLLARDLGILQAENFESLASRVVEVKRMLSGLAATVRRA